MKHSVYFLLFFFPFYLLAQNPTPISGVINDYTFVTAIDTCLAAVSVDDPSFFQTGDRVLLIQMQGAHINESNSASFGNIDDIGSAGRYEKGTVSAVTGNAVLLTNSLLHPYDPAGSVQLVRVPVYDRAFTDGEVTGKPWDGQTGGIVAFEVINDLEFRSGAIQANGIGFRGGISLTVSPNDCSFLTQQSDYFYPGNNWRGAEKGEGIAKIISGKELGRGAQANGGGGGNDHNSGGGGGANGGAGGQGGENEEPSLFGCKGNNPGRGGIGLNYLPEERIFMGGGGGAGHSNNNRGTNGGNGGGIVLLDVGSVKVNNPAFFYVEASGESPVINVGDGAGGGGAGGRVLIKAETFDPGFLMIATGGDGGTVNNQNQDRCFGPGGGGGGGVVAVASSDISSITFSSTAGISGMSTNSTSCNDGPNGATIGLIGSTNSFSGFPESIVPIEALSIVLQPQPLQICAGQQVLFQINATGSGVQYQWQINTGGGFVNLSNDALYSGTNTSQLMINAASPTLSGALFRCQVSNACFGSLNSFSALLEVLPFPQAGFIFSLTDATATFVNQSAEATTFLWNFGDGQTSSQTDPTHTYANDGTYTAQLIASNSCGSDTISLVIVVNTVVAPVAAFTLNQNSGCAPLSVQFFDQSANAPQSWQWSFPGGSPASATVADPVVVYSIPGVYDVTLEVSNGAGSDAVVQSGLVEVFDQPSANFNFNLNAAIASFNNLSTAADNYLWDFGDGQTSNQSDPVHTFPGAGNYTVQLIAFNLCGTDTFSVVVNVVLQLPPVADFTLNQAGGCAPFSVQFIDLSENALSWQWTFAGGNPATSTEANPLVLYQQPGEYSVSLQVTNAAGSDELVYNEIILIKPKPEPEFSFTIDNSTVHFVNQSQDAETYAWDFGDGSPLSDEVNPSHTYAGSGLYQVTLTASNVYCSKVIAQDIGLFPLGVENEAAQEDWTLWPNPGNGLFYLSFSEAPGDCLVWLFDVGGKMVRKENMQLNKSEVIDFQGVVPGVYWLHIAGKRGSSGKRVVLVE